MTREQRNCVNLTIMLTNLTDNEIWFGSILHKLLQKSTLDEQNTFRIRETNNVPYFIEFYQNKGKISD